jgi:4-diphosphocytidyl-2-C-methyl-D-erythritol kinase
MTATDAVITQKAPAKINLTLHVTGQRADGYHLLDSLVMFTELSDVIEVRDADDLTLAIVGPYGAGLPTGENNLVLRAARLMTKGRGAHITLTKNLPVASGIGGGSADAAATLFALQNLWSEPLPDWSDIVALGADVPVCLSHELTRMTGIGDTLDLITPMPPLPMLLVNPNVGVSTPAVFAALTSKTNAAMPDTMPEPFDTADWITWLRDQRNDLEAPAILSAPVIATILSSLNSQNGCQIARMSGSGATCFAIFETDLARDAAAQSLRVKHPDWWVAPTSALS